jgi:hypothetical protein
MLKFFTKQLHDTVDDELGQRWCLGCGEFVFSCTCGPISLGRKLMLRLRRPRVDVDPIYGPCPIHETWRGEMRCTFCMADVYVCRCQRTWSEDDYREWYLDHFDGRDVMTEDELASWETAHPYA